MPDWLSVHSVFLTDTWLWGLMLHKWSLVSNSSEPLGITQLLQTINVTSLNVSQPPVSSSQSKHPAADLQAVRHVILSSLNDNSFLPKRLLLSFWNLQRYIPNTNRILLRYCSPNTATFFQWFLEIWWQHWHVNIWSCWHSIYKQDRRPVL